MKNPNYLLKRILISFIIVFSVNNMRPYEPSVVSSFFASVQDKRESNSSITTEDRELIGGIIVLRSAEGRSYMADRDLIATMPEIKTQKEAQAFITHYKHSDEDAIVATRELEIAGFTIVAQDNLFIIVSAPASAYQNIFPLLSYEELVDGNSTTIIHNKAKIFGGTTLSQLIDGLIIPPRKNIIGSASEELNSNSKTLTNSTSAELQTTIYSDYSIIRDALKLNPAHALRITGEGVRVGFIDQGVFAGHTFFSAYPANIKYLKYSLGNIKFVTNNFSSTYDSSHGTTVASYLVNSAPDAKFYSMAIPNPDDYYTGDFLLGYITFINQYHLIDILSLSQGMNEEIPGVREYIPELRAGFLNFISQGGIVLVAGGNYGQATAEKLPEYDSGHNAIAAIPEVIAVGGSTLVPVGPTYVFNAAAGASSFSSIIFPGRHVPDIVSVYGPTRTAENDGSYGTGYGTSFSTPQIAGMVALLKETIPDLTNEMAKTILKNNSFDITSGKSGDGDFAGVGYDIATGYGQPLTTWVLQGKEILYPGWNFIGLTTTYDYTAETLLRDIQSQGGDCDSLAVYRGAYDTIVIANGTLYGYDFDIYPEEAIWIRCYNKVYWSQASNDYVDSVIPIQLYTGWNGITVPYANDLCSASEIYKETGGLCWTVSEYDGKFNSYINRNGQEYGENIYLSSGSGYFVRCDSRFLWTPDCTSESFFSEIDGDTYPKNVYTLSSSISLETAIIEKNNTMINALESTNCAISNIEQSNITGNTFSISWTTPDPCPGSLLVSQGGEDAFQAFDDRGLQYSGTTHHITVRGLDPITTYSYQILSGDINGTNSSITTGTSLPQPSTSYTAKGIVLGDDFSLSPNALIYGWLADSSGNTSSNLSFALNQNNDGFTLVLGNARKLSNFEYFPLSTATRLYVNIQGGSAGYFQFNLPLALTTTPQVETGATILDGIPSKPTLIFPIKPIMDYQPTFQFYADGTSTIKYRLELSKDNFSTIEFVYDQRENLSGWSSSSYEPNQLASFTIPIPLENMVAYQWRVMAYDVNYHTWGAVSDVTGFSIVRLFNYLPILYR